MIRDKLNLFSEDGDFANEAGTANIGDIIDLGLAGQDLGNGGNPAYLGIVVKTAADGGAGGNATVALQLVSDSTSTIAVDGSQTIHITSDAFTAAQLTVGKKFFFPLPVSGAVYERYLGLQIVTAVEGEDALVCDGFITLTPAAWVAHADASN